MESKPSIIDGILSMSFDQCNVVANDTSVMANEMAGKSLRKYRDKNLFVVDPELHIGTPETLYIHPNIHTFVDIATDIPSANVSGTAKVVFEVSQDGRPRVLALFGNSLALPLATFDSRTGGECRYVQLGQEIHEDSLVTSSEDNRTSIVNAIRSVLEQDATEEDTRILGNFIDFELNRAENAEAIDQLGASLLAKRIQDTLIRKSAKAELEPVYLGGNEKFEYTTVNNLGTLYLPGGRPLTLSLLGAGGKFSWFDRRVKQPPEVIMLVARDQTQQLSQVLAEVRNGRLKTFKDGVESDPSQSELEAINTVLGHDYDLFSDIVKSERNSYLTHSADDLVEELQETEQLKEEQEAIEQGLREEAESVVNSTGYLPDIERDIEAKLASARREKLITNVKIRTIEAVIQLKNFTSVFGIESYFLNGLGEYNSAFARLFSCVGKLALKGGEHELIVPDRNFGNATSDTSFQIRAKDTGKGLYWLDVDAKPVNYDGSSYADIFEGYIPKSSKNTIDPDMVDELLGLAKEAVANLKLKK